MHKSSLLLFIHYYIKLGITVYLVILYKYNGKHIIRYEDEIIKTYT